jgi:hypothetical protein
MFDEARGSDDEVKQVIKMFKLVRSALFGVLFTIVAVMGAVAIIIAVVVGHMRLNLQSLPDGTPWPTVYMICASSGGTILVALLARKVRRRRGKGKAANAKG